MEASAPAKRMAQAERREQLVEAALAVAAHEGHERLTFEGVARRAGVTRNLVYHYFPNRQELLKAVVHRAGSALSGDWVTDPNVPLAERVAANLDRMMDHAAEPTDAWLLYRQARGAVDPELLEIGSQYRERIIENISLNQLGTSEPPPMVRIAINGFIAFVETTVESALQEGMERQQVLELVGATMLATVNAAVGAGIPPAPPGRTGGS